MHYVYILKSLKNNKSYTGFTNKKPKEKLQEHNSGASKFTRQNKPWKLIYYERYSKKPCAREREQFFKTGQGKKLKKLILNNY